VRLDTSQLVLGEHLLTARGVTGRPLPAASLRFQVVAPPPTVTVVEPPTGPVAGDAPLSIVIHFSEPVSFNDATEPFGLTTIPGWGPTVAFATLASDGRSVRFDIATPGNASGFSLHGLVRNRRGATLRFRDGADLSWTVNQLLPQFQYWSGPELNVKGLVQIRLSPGDRSAPPRTEVLANDQVIATLGVPPWTVEWNTDLLPEGPYTISLRASGFAVHHGLNWPTYVVDRTPPSATCAGWAFRAPEAASQVGLEECVRLTFNEPIVRTNPDIQLIDDGTPIASFIRSYEFDAQAPPNTAKAAVVCPATPRRSGASEQVVMRGLADLAGNPVTPGSCSVTVPPTFAPWGAGRVIERPFEPHVSGLSVTGWQGNNRIGDPWWYVTLAMVGAPGTDLAGRVLLGDLFGPEPYVSLVLANATSTSFSSPVISDYRLLALETAGPGNRDVIPFDRVAPGYWWTAGAAPLDAVETNDADELVLRASPGVVVSAQGPGVAVWTEGPPGGPRTLQGAETLEGATLWTPLAGDPRGAVTSSVSQPALYVHHPASSPAVALVAFLETAPAGAVRLRSASIELGGGVWLPVLADLDLGLGAPSDPAIAMAGDLPAVAWIEDGQVRVRMGTLDAAGLSFGPALDLNHDAALPARAARLVATLGARATLLFIERGPTGDQLWARQWNGASWVLQPGPINAGTGEVIDALAADGVPDALGVVAWTDALGRVYLRVLNW
jgi:hypothetical protein